MFFIVVVCHLYNSMLIIWFFNLIMSFYCQNIKLDIAFQWKRLQLFFFFILGTFVTTSYGW